MTNPYRSPGPAPQLGGPPPYAYDAWSPLPDPRLAAHPQMAPSYCEMQDHWNGGGGAGWPPRNGPSPIPQGPGTWSQPQYPPDYLHSRGNPNPGDNQFGRAFGNGCQSPYAFHSPPTPPRERKIPEAATRAQAMSEASSAGSWEILSEESGWQPWNPGVQFYGRPGEELQFNLGQYVYYAVFESADTGTQVNLYTGKRHALRRHQRLERMNCVSSGRIGEAALDAELQRESSLLRGPWTIDAQDDRRPMSPTFSGPTRPHGDQPLPGNFQLPQPSPLPGVSSTNRPVAHDVASEAYRELQKLGQGSAPPEQLEPAPVIVLGNGMLGSDLDAGASYGLYEAPAAAPPREEVKVAIEPNIFALLEDLQNQMQVLESRIPVILEALDDGAIAPGQARDSFAQLEARLSKLQCNGIDSISTAGLEPDRADEARAIRKRLTLKAERLQSHLEDIFTRIRMMSTK